MKIVHVEDHFDPEAGYQINELIRASKNYNDEITVITSKEMTSYHKELDVELDKKYEKEMNIKIIRLDHKFKISSRLYIPRIFKEIDRINPDIVFLHGIGDFKDLELLKKEKDYIIIRDCHMSWVASKNKFNKLFYFLYANTFSKIINRTNKYKKVFALGDEEYEYLRALGIKDKKINFLRHGYNSEIMYYHNESRELIRNNYNIKSDDIVIAYIGKLNDSKRPDFIFDILKFIPKDLLSKKNLVLLFIGTKDSTYIENKFTPKLNQIDPSIKVIVDDYKPFIELYKYFSATDICVFPEETTLSSIHAQVCGNPVIMAKYDSNKERVINNNNLFEVQNFKEAAEILVRIIQNKEYKKEYNLNHEKILDREYSNQIKNIRLLLED